MKYNVAEIFTSPQGEGLHTGVPMTFIRLVGCSVGKTVCQHCDTDFDKSYPWKGGGAFHAIDLLREVRTDHVCITGGEPFNWDLRDLWYQLREHTIHVETSGTVLPEYMMPGPQHIYTDHNEEIRSPKLWITVSPKPGFLKDMVLKYADEVKVIVPGLGNGEGWPTLQNAIAWANAGKLVYLQPRNHKDKIDPQNLALVTQLVTDHPNLRLSVQMHKYLNVR
jgi:7-carboxy-7-deazaguanine synthase